MIRAILLIAAATGADVGRVNTTRNGSVADGFCNYSDGWCCTNIEGKIVDLGCPPDYCVCTWGPDPCINANVCMECNTTKPPGAVAGMCSPLMATHCTGCTLPVVIAEY